jgi:hypothetical protein
MKVVETTRVGVEYGEERDYGISIEIESGVTGEKESASFSEGETEDMTLGRDLSDAYSLYSLVKLAYDCGKRGEEFNPETITEREE